MPTVFRSGPYRFFFFSNEGFEPVHVHVEGSGGYAKLWMDPVRFAEAHGLNSRQLSHIRQVVREHRNEIVEAWHAHFAHQD